MHVLCIEHLYTIGFLGTYGFNYFLLFFPKKMHILPYPNKQDKQKKVLDSETQDCSLKAQLRENFGLETHKMREMKILTLYILD